MRRRTVGSGLGLAISRQLVRLMGGEIHVASEPGRGTDFSFELQLQVVRAALGGPSAQGCVIGYEGPRKRILIVDDMPANRLVLWDMLRPLGFEIEEAADGKQALEHARAWPPDLVVMGPGLEADAFLAKPLDRARLLRETAVQLGLKWITAESQVGQPL